MLEEGTLRKMKGLLATSNRLPPWSSVVDQYSQDQVISGVSGIQTLNSWFVLCESELRKDLALIQCAGVQHQMQGRSRLYIFHHNFYNSKLEVAELRALTVSFLNFMSGGEPARLLEVSTVFAMVMHHIGDFIRPV